MTAQTKEWLFFSIRRLLLVFAVLIDGAFFLYLAPVPLVPRPGIAELVILTVAGSGIWFAYMISVVILTTILPTRYPESCQPS